MKALKTLSNMSTIPRLDLEDIAQTIEAMETKTNLNTQP